jgi:3-oxoacyl-[acyl-carrier-protein] synthase III
MTTYSRITGTGSYLPPRRVTNADLVADLAQRGIESSDEWIVERVDFSFSLRIDWIKSFSVCSTKSIIEM